MYTIRRAEGKIIVVDSNGSPVFTSPDDGYIIYKTNVLGENTVKVSKAGDLKDGDLLLAIVNHLKIPA